MRRAFLIPFGSLAILWSFLAVPLARADEMPVSFWDHNHKVVTVAFSPDGKTLATADQERRGGVVLWDRATMTRRVTLDDPGVAYHIIFEPTGRWFVTAGEAPGEPPPRGRTPALAVVVWDAATGKKRFSLELSNGEVRHVAVSPDGKLLATGNADGTVTLWNAATGKELSLLKGHRGPVAFVAFSPDGRTLASSGEADRMISLWDVTSGKERAILAGHRGTVLALVFAPDGRTLISSGDCGLNAPGELKRWDVGSGKEQLPILPAPRAVVALARSPDGKTLAAGGRDGTVRVYDLDTRKERQPFAGSMDLRQTVFAPDGKMLAVVGLSGEPPALPAGLRLWDLETGKEFLSPALTAQRDWRETLVRRRRAEQARARAARQEVGARLKEATESARRAEYALRMGEARRAWERWEFGPARNLLERLRPSKGGPDLRGFEWCYLHALLPREVRLCQYKKDSFAVVALSPAGETVAVAVCKSEKDSRVLLFDTQTGKQRAVYKGERSLLESLAFTPDGLILAEGGELGSLTLRDVITGKVRARLRGHTGSINALAFTSDGTTLASGADGAIRLWDVRSGKLRHVLPVGKASTVQALAFSADGKMVVAGIRDRLTRLWDVATGKEVGHLPALRGASDIAFAPHTGTLATSHHGVVALWDARTCRPIRSFLSTRSEPLTFVEHGQHLLCGLALFDPLTGRERANVVRNTHTSRPEQPTKRYLLERRGDALRWYREPISTGVISDPTLVNGFSHLGSGPVGAVNLSPAGRLVAVLVEDKEVKVLDAAVDLGRKSLSEEGENLVSLAWSGDGRGLLGRTDHDFVRRWDAAGKEQLTLRELRRRFPSLPEFKIPYFSVSPPSLGGESGDLAKIDFSVRPPRVRTDDFELSLADFAAIGGAGIARGQEVPYWVLGLSPDRRTLLTGERMGISLSLDEKAPLVLRDAGTGKPRVTLPPFQRNPERTELAFSAAGRVLVTWADDVVSWDTMTGRELDRIEVPGKVLAVQFAADRKTPKTLVVEDRRTSIYHLWDVATGETRASLRGHTDFLAPGAVAFAPDGQTLATGGKDGVVRLWDAVTGHLRFVLRGHPAEIYHVAFRPDGKALAVAGAGGSVSLWVIGQGRRVE